MTASPEARPRRATSLHALPPRSRRRSIQRHVTSVYAHDQIAAAMYRVVVDAVKLGPCNLGAERHREWLRAAIQAPLRSSADAALNTLAADLARALDNAPPDLRRWLDAPDD